jgi:hypothetical protein
MRGALAKPTLGLFQVAQRQFDSAPHEKPVADA